MCINTLHKGDSDGDGDDDDNNNNKITIRMGRLLARVYSIVVMQKTSYTAVL
jgi:hypothetical protein